MLKRKGKLLRKSGFLKRTPLRRVSKKRARELRVYNKERDQFLEENPTCMIDGCNEPPTNHHARGRVGNDLIDKKYFRNICWPHHTYFEEHPEEAKALGISVSRLSKAS